MFNKRSILTVFLMFLILIVSISAVSAISDVSDTSDTSDSSINNNYKNSKNSISKYTIANDGKGNITIGGSSTIKDAINALPNGNGTIYLNSSSYSGSGNVNITLADNTNVTIIGKNNTVIKGNASNWFINIGPNTYLTLVNLTFTNFYASYGTSAGNGAVIGSQGILNINNCNFTYSTSDRDVFGGAIYINIGSTGNISNCIFSNNRAADGGAIYSKGDLNISNCSFINNGAGSAGAILSSGKLNIKSSNFISSSGSDCSVRNNNGGILNISNSKFTDNTGAIFNLGNAFLTNVTFFNNDKSGFGSVIYNQDANITLNNCIVNSNFARYDEWTPITGGIIYNHANSKLTINGGIFTNNICYGNSNGFGGVIYNNGSLNISNASFINNSANYGGAIYSENGIINISSCDISYNTGTITGNAFYIVNGSINSTYSRYAGYSNSANDYFINDDFGASIYFNNYYFDKYNLSGTYIEEIADNYLYYVVKNLTLNIKGNSYELLFNLSLNRYSTDDNQLLDEGLNLSLIKGV
ncbi:MAG: right-handed parallel beta-helix repeat-containing protein, partial [Methanobacteriaceae archaeon]